jgi:3-hydroxyacyl-[acyl-carrier-protein] dehydratase
MTNPVMDHVEVRQDLPHRYPFLLVDKVVELEVGKRIVGIKNVTTNEPFFTGHFPHMPVMPGVLIVEAMAQTSGMLIYKTLDRLPSENEDFFFAGIDNARFKRVVVPGDQLRMEIEFVKQRLDLWKFKGTVTVDGELACSAEFMNIRNERDKG